MKLGKTSATVKDRWNKKAYDDIKLRVKKGDKETIQLHAESLGLSVNSYINQLIENDMKNKNIE